MRLGVDEVRPAVVGEGDPFLVVQMAGDFVVGCEGVEVSIGLDAFLERASLGAEDVLRFGEVAVLAARLGEAVLPGA